MPTNIRKEIIRFSEDSSPISELEAMIQGGGYPKIGHQDMEYLINELFMRGKDQILRLVLSYAKRLSSSTTPGFLHLAVVKDRLKADSKGMIACYKYIYMYTRFIDCSMLLAGWSPTEPYFPVLLYIHKSNPDKPIDYTVWLRRPGDLQLALKFLEQNSIPIEFTDTDSLIELYRTIPDKYIEQFIRLLGYRAWYIEAIKEEDARDED